MMGDYERWKEETGALYDNAIREFYGALTAEDKGWLAGAQVDIFGDARPAKLGL